MNETDSDVNDNETFEKVVTTDDIYKCRRCDHTDQAILLPNERKICQECHSDNLQLYVRAPTLQQRQLLRARNSRDPESALTELDPEWRDRFGGDTDRAIDFYIKE